MASCIFFTLLVVLLGSNYGTAENSPGRKEPIISGGDTCSANNCDQEEFQAKITTPNPPENEPVVKAKESNSTALISYTITSLGSLLSEAFCSMWEYVKIQGEKVTSTVTNKTKAYIENIRKLLREEFGLYYGIETALSVFTSNVSEEGSVLNTLYIYMWNIILLVHILILNYLFLYYIPLFLILGFDCGVILLLYVFNSEKVLRSFYSSIIYLTQTLYFMFTEFPRATCVVIVLVCIIMCLWYIYTSWFQPIYAHCERKDARKHRKTVADSILGLQKKIDSIDERLRKLDEYIRNQN